MASELVDRLKDLKTVNSFWSNTRKILVGLSLALIAVSEFAQPLLHDELVPVELKEYLRYAYVAGLFGGLLASLTKVDAPHVEQ